MNIFFRILGSFFIFILFTGCTPEQEISKEPEKAPVNESEEIPQRHEEVLETSLPIDQIKLPEGFSISVYSEKIPGARSLALGINGTLFVGSRKEGTVYALPDQDRDGIPEEVLLIASSLNSPNGVAMLDGDLYVAEISRILKFENIEENLENPPEPQIVLDTLPKDTHHGWKYIAFGPDGKLYVPVGAPCNVCEKSDERYASILRMNPDGSDLEVFAKGIRNTVGFDWLPDTKELWFTDNGRDWLGNDAPADELNHAPDKGMHFGFPYCHSTNTLDPIYGRGKNCSDYTLPEIELGPHVAALGMKFYTGNEFPEEYRNQIFIAEHGSWNRNPPIGYRVTLARLEGNKAVSYEPFAEGWLQGGNAWGRPVDVLVMPDGSLLVTDDLAGAVYKISYGK